MVDTALSSPCPLRLVFARDGCLYLYLHFPIGNIHQKCWLLSLHNLFLYLAFCIFPSAFLSSNGLSLPPGGKIARDDASADGFRVAEGLSCHGNNIKMIKLDFFSGLSWCISFSQSQMTALRLDMALVWFWIIFTTCLSQLSCSLLPLLYYFLPFSGCPDENHNQSLLKRIQHIYTCFFHPEVQIVLIVSWITELKITAWHLFFYSTPLSAFTLLPKEMTARLYSGRAALHVILDFIKFSLKKKWQKYLELPLNDDFPLTKASLTWAYSHDMMHLDEILFAINYLLIAYSRWEKIIMRSFMKWRWVRFLIPDGNQQGSKWVNSVIHSAD